MSRPTFEPTVAGFHEDHRRFIFPVLNGDVSGFPNIQVKGALVKPGQTVVMGNHYHPEGYDEIYVTVTGMITWRLYHKDFPSEIIVHKAPPGSRVIIYAGWAHQATVPAGATFIGISTQPYIPNTGIDIAVDASTFDR